LAAGTYELLIPDIGFTYSKFERESLLVRAADRSWITRFRRPDYGRLDIEVTIEDPTTFSKPWKIHVVWDLVPDDEIQEFVCENNKDPLRMVTK
jgi:hypothetical protein